MNRARDGHTRVYMRSNGWYSVPLDQYGLIRETWMAGKAWIEVPGLYGAMVTFKLAEVECVREMTAEAYAATEADELAEKANSMLNGGSAD